MKTSINNLITSTFIAISKAFKSVIIDGNANNQEKAIVFITLFIPLFSAALIFGHFPVQE